MTNPAKYYQKRKKELKNKCNRVLEKYFQNLNESAYLLDIGSGSFGAFDHPILDKFNRISLDIDTDALSNNTTTDIKVCADARVLPFRQHCIDAAISRDCLEHIEDAKFIFSELQRTMKHNGIFITLIPNQLWIVSIFAFIFPNKMNDFVWRILLKRKKMLYPVFYEINTARKWKIFSKRYNFQIEHFEHYHEVSHWFTRFPIPLFWLIEFLQLPLKVPAFKKLRSTILVVVKFNPSN